MGCTSMSSNYKQRYAIDKKNEARLLAFYPELDNQSGIYFLTREDESGIKYTYIGQAKHILKRLVDHLSGYQHIDLSLKKHGLYSNANHYGWKIGYMTCPIEELDRHEQYWIKRYADNGYQLRNKTAGGQGEGKVQIDEYRPAKGYRDGLKQGRKNLARELYGIIDKHLVVSIQPEKANNKISQRMYNKFWELLMTDESEGTDEK